VVKITVLEGSPLGTITVFAGGPVFGPVLDPAAEARIARYELQAVSRDLLGESRLRVCLLCMVPGAAGVKVLHNPSRGSAHYGNLVVCGLLWVCPVCAAKISERRREEITRAIAIWESRGGVVLIGAYTFSHGPAEALREALGRFVAAQRSMTTNDAYKRLLRDYRASGTINVLETTWGDVNGWHPHRHVLFFLDGSRAVDLADFEERLYGAWSRAAMGKGLTMDREHGVKVQGSWAAIADYLAKWGQMPTRRVWDASDEMTKGHLKRDRSGVRYTPFDLLRSVADVGDADHARLFQEYAVAFYRRRQLRWSPGLRELLGLDVEKDDEQLAREELDDALLLMLLTVDEWRAVKRHNLRAQVLEVARSGDAAAVAAFVAGVVAF